MQTFYDNAIFKNNFASFYNYLNFFVVFCFLFRKRFKLVQSVKI